jgi:hypothetical protein
MKYGGKDVNRNSKITIRIMHSARNCKVAVLLLNSAKFCIYQMNSGEAPSNQSKTKYGGHKPEIIVASATVN